MATKNKINPVQEKYWEIKEMTPNDRMSATKELLDYIKSTSVKEIVEDVLARVPEVFFHGPASSSLKYHPEECRGDQGLLTHTKLVVKIAKVMLDTEHRVKHPDYVLAACILHDALKYGWTPGQYTVYDHPELIYEYMVDHALNNLKVGRFEKAYDCYKIAKLVRTHHGRFGDHKPSSLAQTIVSYADMLAAYMHTIR